MSSTKTRRTNSRSAKYVGQHKSSASTSARMLGGMDEQEDSTIPAPPPLPPVSSDATIDIGVGAFDPAAPAPASTSRHEGFHAGPGTEHSWPFNAHGPPSPVPPSSPSQIHPDYKDHFVSPDLSQVQEGFPNYSATLAPSHHHQAYDYYPSAPRVSTSQPFSSNPQDTSVHFTAGNDEKPRPFYAQSMPFAASAHAPASSSGSMLPPVVKQALDTPTAWLIYYFIFNLGLTLYNKLVLVKFPFPWTVTAIHTLCGGIGSSVLQSRGVFEPASLGTRENLILVAFSVLYTVNIAVSNLSLNLVTVPFHQVVRAMTPLFTIAIAAAFLHKRHSRKTYLSLIPVVMGVGFATYGDYYCTRWGFLLTVFGTLLAALKTIVTNLVQVGRLKLHPLDLLLRMSPLAFVQCVVASYFSGEMDKVRTYGATEMTRLRAIGLACNGLIAFGLNIVSFSANKKTSALTMTVAANVKQVLTILLAVYLFNLSVTMMNLLGISLTLGGGAWYAHVEYTQKQQQQQNKPSLETSTHVPLVQVIDGVQHTKQ